MFSSLAYFVTYVSFFVATAVLLKADAARARRLAKARGEVDFVDRGVGAYLIFALVSGVLPLLFYFGTTRKGLRGWLLALGVTAGTFVGCVLFGAVLLFGANRLDARGEAADNARKYAAVEAACAGPADAPNDPCVLVKTTWFAHEHAADGAKLEAKAYALACDRGRAWACDWFVTASLLGDVSSEEAQRSLATKRAICARSPSATGC